MTVPHWRCVVLSVVKHAYVPRGVAAHPQFEIVVVADDADRPEWVHQRNQELADEFGVPYVRDVARALADFNVQVAVVSSEAERHCDLSVRAIEAGLHVVQDKPMSNRLSECERVVAAVERRGVKFLMWNRNFLPAVVQARDLIANGEIGEVRSIHVDFYFAKDAGPPTGSRGPDDPPIDWLTFQIAAHVDGSDGAVGTQPLGELSNEGIYPLGYIQMVCGAVVKRVFARTAAHFHQVNVDNHVEDLATVTLEMERGIVGSLCVGRIGNASHPDIGEIKLHVVGSKGALVVSEARPEVGVYYRGQPDKEFKHRRVANDADYTLMENFAQAIAHNTPTVLDARTGWHICATVQAALESAKTGRVTAVPTLSSGQV
ncbi:MAG: Gfo/Idh/MocA family oxidoreductase [Planctomycetota bacterium]|nr:Gfo/Idh/MocA family oxidoreductase [Planctomycetota bacterium]